MQKIIEGLNPQQLKAVMETEGYVRIIAGAGSGKTKALTHRYAFIIKSLGVPPENILCVTFTNKAANEMKKRVKKLIGEGYDTSLITTYHGFCVRVLRESISKLFYPENFLILDIQDQKKILEEIYDELEIKLDHSSFESILKKIEIKKATPDYVDLMVNPSLIININESKDLDDKIFKMYIQRQKKVFGLDFNDLINFTFVLFERFPNVLKMWQKRLNYIQVDEFQDTSNRELKLINMLSEINKNLFVVGDPDQNIYEWRGAKVEILVDFDKQYKDTKTIIMNQNYRSTPQILAVSNSLIEKNQLRIKKDLFTENSNGSNVVFYHAKTETDEATWICSKIKALKKTENYSYNDILILYRANYLSRFIEAALFSENLPYKIWGGIRFFERMEIKDALAYLRMIIYKDDISLSRIINVPKRRFGKANMTKLREYADFNNLNLYEALKAGLEEGKFSNTSADSFVDIIEFYSQNYKKMKISELFNDIMEKSGYKTYIRENGNMDRLENLAELSKNITEFERAYAEDASAEMYINQAYLQYDPEDEDNKETIKLMTVHSSKGLEFPVVFICGLTDGVFPSSRTVEERRQAGLEEERRLLFVGMTRAKKRLYLSDSEGFNNSGARKTPSRFLFNIAENLLDRIGIIPKDIYEQSKAKASENIINAVSKKLSLGDSVNHPLFGPGKIESIDEKKQVYIIYFENLKQIRPIMMSFNWDAYLQTNKYLVNNKEQDINKFNNDDIDKDNKNEKVDDYNIEKETEENKNLSIDVCMDASIHTDTLNIAQSQLSNNYTLFKTKEDNVVINDNKDEVLNDDNENEDEPSKEKSLGIIKTIENEKEIVFSVQKGENIGFIGQSNNLDDEEFTNLENSQYPEEILKQKIIVDEKNFDPKKTVNNKKKKTENGNINNHWNDPDFPKSDWVNIDIIDLGKPDGICGMCNNQAIRYVHKMEHPTGLRLGVGCVCAGNMEGNKEAAIKRETEFKNKQQRKNNFLKRQWKKSSKGNFYIKYKQKIIVIMPDRFKLKNWLVICDSQTVKGINDFQKAKEIGFEIVERLVDAVPENKKE